MVEGESRLSTDPERFRLFLAYERPWWRALGLMAGRFLTDLPIRQIYYHGVTGSYFGPEVPFWEVAAELTILHRL